MCFQMYFLLFYVPKQALRNREFCTPSTVFLSAYALSEFSREIPPWPLSSSKSGVRRNVIANETEGK